MGRVRAAIQDAAALRYVANAGVMVTGVPAGGPTAGVFFTRWVTHDSQQLVKLAEIHLTPPRSARPNTADGSSR